MNGHKRIFFTSDLHIGHANVLQYDARPFKNLDQMHEALVTRFNACVTADAVTYFLGDVGLGSGSVVEQVVRQLNGTKVLVLGNHDKGMHAMYNAGFDVVLNSASIYIANQRVTMSHCPLRGLYRENITGMKGGQEGENWHGETKQTRFSIVDEGQFHLHGHIHSPNGGKSVKILGKQYDVGVVANGFRPVSISEIESWITKYGR